MLPAGVVHAGVVPRRDVALAGRGFGISQATAYRYLNEAIDWVSTTENRAPAF